MEIIFAPKAVEHLAYWQKTGNKIIQNKIEHLIKAIQENPFSGIGKPEQLKYELSGYWSRRINEEHRIIYAVLDDVLNIYSLKGHYK